MTVVHRKKDLNLRQGRIHDLVLSLSKLRLPLSCELVIMTIRDLYDERFNISFCMPLPLSEPILSVRDGLEIRLNLVKCKEYYELKGQPFPKEMLARALLQGDDEGSKVSAWQ